MNAPLPKPIQRSIEAAASAQAALSQPDPTSAPVVDSPAQLAAVESTASAQQSAGDPASVTPPADQPQTKQDQLARADDWEQKYRSLQGRMRAELAEAAAQNKLLQSQISQMQGQIEALVAAAKAAEKKEKPAADPKDVENFGADMIDMVQRYAERVFQSMSDQYGQSMQALTARVTKLEEMVTGVSSRTEMTLEQQFYAALAAAVPDWEQINADERWLRWLAEVDPIYGVPRQVGLDDARNRLDVQRVVNIFREFKRTLPAKQAQSLSNQVAPNGAAAPVPNAPAEKPIFTAKFVERFYNDKAKGRISEADAARIEAEINLAAAEGRIR